MGGGGIKSIANFFANQSTKQASAFVEKGTKSYAGWPLCAHDSFHTGLLNRTKESVLVATHATTMPMVRVISCSVYTVQQIYTAAKKIRAR